jgi:hypothetical protein
MHKEKGSTRKELIKAENDPNLYQYEDRSNLPPRVLNNHRFVPCLDWHSLLTAESGTVTTLNHTGFFHR